MGQRPGKGVKMEVLWDNKAWVSSKHELATHINGRLARWEETITNTFNELWDAAPFTQVSRTALVRRLFPVQTPSGHKLAENKTFRELLAEWKHLHRNLDTDSLRKHDQMATMIERWQPDLRPEQVTQKVVKEYQQHLLDLQKSDATIKVHFGGIRKCLEQLGLPHDMAWLQYSAKNAP
jgi:hypothetical protein